MSLGDKDQDERNRDSEGTHMVGVSSEHTSAYHALQEGVTMRDITEANMETIATNDGWSVTEGQLSSFLDSDCPLDGLNGRSSNYCSEFAPENIPKSDRDKRGKSNRQNDMALKCSTPFPELHDLGVRR